MQRVRFPIDFIEFGTKKTLDEKSWTNDRLFVDLEAITDVSNGIRVNERSNERVSHGSKHNPESTKTIVLKRSRTGGF